MKFTASASACLAAAAAAAPLHGASAFAFAPSAGVASSPQSFSASSAGSFSPAARVPMGASPIRPRGTAMSMMKSDKDTAQEATPASPEAPAAVGLPQFWENLRQDLSKKATTLGAVAMIAAAVAGALPGDAMAASSGGRMGGRSSFGGGGGMRSRSMSAPTRSYSTPMRSSGGGIMPVPVAVPMFSPFGFGGGYGMGFSPFGYGGMGMGIGFNPINLLIVGGVLYGISSVLNSGGGGFREYDEDSYSSLGNGASVIKVQVALNCGDRSTSGIIGQLREIARRAETQNMGGLSSAVSEASLALVRRQNDWTAGAAAYEHLGNRNMDKAESKFNAIAFEERAKVEKETFAKQDGLDLREEKSSGGMGGPTQAVVTLVLALRGDSLKQYGLGDGVASMSQLKSALSQLAGDVQSEGGDNLLAAELLWTPEQDWDTLSRQDVIADFPELVDM